MTINITTRIPKELTILQNVAKTRLRYKKKIIQIRQNLNILFVSSFHTWVHQSRMYLCIYIPS